MARRGVEFLTVIYAGSEEKTPEEAMKIAGELLGDGRTVSMNEAFQTLLGALVVHTLMTREYSRMGDDIPAPAELLQDIAARIAQSD